MKKCLTMLTVAAMMVACGADNSKEQAAAAAIAKAKEAVDVKVAAATISNLDVCETYTAELKAYKEINVTPAAQGLHIKEILVDVGDTVTEGQVIAKLDDTTLKQLEIQLATTQDTYDRLKPVRNAGGVSEQQFVQTENTLNALKEQLDQLRKNTVITSPISGVVTARNFEVGDLFASMPLFHIMQVDKLKVKVYVSERYFPDVKLGQSVDISTDIYPGVEFTANVSRINPAIDPSTRTFEVEVTIPNSVIKKEEPKEDSEDSEETEEKSLRLVPGMSAKATFVMSQRNSVIVPAVAVQKQTGSADRFVFVIKDGVADYRFVKDGLRVGENIEILDGVQVGESVAITGLARLLDGKNVNIVE